MFNVIIDMKNLFFTLCLTGFLLIVSGCPRENSTTGVNRAQTAVELSKQDLAGLISLPPAKIELVSVKEAWPTRATGLPQYVVVLKAGDQEYEYKADEDDVILSNITPAAPTERTGTVARPRESNSVTRVPEEGLSFPVETTGLMDGKPWMPVN